MRRRNQNDPIEPPVPRGTGGFSQDTDQTFLEDYFESMVAFRSEGLGILPRVTSLNLVDVGSYLASRITGDAIER